MTAPKCYRQECPSCGEWIPIRDPSVIGRKIVCPTCQYRFVLPQPGDDTAASHPASTGNPAGKVTGIRKAPVQTGKSAPRIEEDEDEDEEEDWEDEDEEDDEDEEEDDDEDEEDEDYEEEEDEEEDDEEEQTPAVRVRGRAVPPPVPSKPQPTALKAGSVLVEAILSPLVAFGHILKTGSEVLRLGTLLAVIGLAALIGGGWYFFFSKTAPTTAPALAGSTPPARDKTEETKAKRRPIIREAPAEPADPSLVAADISNLLPNDTEAVLDIPVGRLLGTVLKQAAFATPNAFSAEAFGKTFGIPIEDVAKVVMARGPGGSWVFAAVRTARPVNKEALAAGLQLAPGPPINGLDYAIINRPLDSLSNFLLKGNLPRGPLALHLLDGRTFVVGDVAPVREFLRAKRQPAEQAGGKRAGATHSFRTVAPPLKAVLDELENAAWSEETVLLRGAVAGPAAFSLLTLLAGHFDVAWNTNGALTQLVRKQVGSNPKGAGLCLLALNETSLVVEVAAHQGSEGRAREAEKQVAAIFPDAFKAGGLDVVREGGPNRPISPANANQGKDGTWWTWSSEEVAALSIRLSLSDVQYQLIVHRLSGLLALARIHAERAEPRPRIRELAEAIQAHVQAKGAFPRGALDRPLTDGRPVPWRPDQRLSWLVDLLPFLPGGDYGTLVVDRGESWNEGVNRITGQMPIPHFLTPSAASGGPWVYYWGQDGYLAASHFVGIAGVGLDAADYRVGDPGTAARLGIFGYDRVTRPEDVRDGLGTTMVAIQVPAEKARPWMAGGGATVRGVSEEADCLEPFVCLDYRGRRGTFALMADGKVRFLPADMPPALFRALCTIAGGETIGNLDQAAPVVEFDQSDRKREPRAVSESRPPSAGPSGKPGTASPASPGS